MIENGLASFLIDQCKLYTRECIMRSFLLPELFCDKKMTANIRRRIRPTKVIS